MSAVKRERSLSYITVLQLYLHFPLATFTPSQPDNSHVCPYRSLQPRMPMIRALCRDSS